VPSQHLYVSKGTADGRNLSSSVGDEGPSTRVRGASPEPEVLVPDEEQAHDGLSG
jgi:hypothetical protein